MTYQPWHNKKTHENYLRPCTGKCTHFYVYFIDEELGLCHLRIPTWAPFRLQFCMNGHNWLANEMTDVGIEFTQVDNAFTWVEDLDAAQKIADEFSPERLHQRLDAMVERFVPTLLTIDGGIQWGIAQIEYSTDIMFDRAEVLKPVYGEFGNSTRVTGGLAMPRNWVRSMICMPPPSASVPIKAWLLKTLMSRQLEALTPGDRGR